MKSIKLRSKIIKKKNELQMYQIINLKKRKKILGRKLCMTMMRMTVANCENRLLNVIFLENKN